MSRKGGQIPSGTFTNSHVRLDVNESRGPDLLLVEGVDHFVELQAQIRVVPPAHTTNKAEIGGSGDADGDPPGKNGELSQDLATVQSRWERRNESSGRLKSERAIRRRIPYVC